MAITTLTFDKQKDEHGKDFWIAETAVSGDYGIHIERKGKGTFRVRQRFTDSGEFAESNVPYSLTDVRKTIEVFMEHGIYPLHIQIISYSEVLSGAIKEKE